jgi:hypothetical protein
MTGEVHAAERSARRAARSTPVKVGARIGIAAYGLTHLLVAWLALQVAFTGSRERADQTGAFQTIGQQPFGRVLLWALVGGFAAVALWRLQEAVWGFAYERERATKLRLRATSAGKVLIFAVLAVLAARAAGGSGGGGGQQQAAAGVLGLPGGQFVVGAVGVGTVVTGVVTVVSGVRTSFRRAMSLPADRRARQVALRSGQVGFVGKGAAIAIVGVLVVVAAIRFRPEEAGLDAALHTLAAQSSGPYLLAVISLGLLAYGVFCFFDARYHRV